MDEKDFNFLRLWKIETEAALPALLELFETLWTLKFPNLPWHKDAKSVEQFEEKEDELFQRSIEGRPGKSRKLYKRNIRKKFYRDCNWSCYKWDISQVVHALIDSKLFDLAICDNGVEVSEHVVKIKDIRNKSAHSKVAKYTSDYFKRTVDQLIDHIESLKLAADIDILPYLNKVQQIESLKAATDGEQFSCMKQEYEKIKSQMHIFEEKEKRSMLIEDIIKYYEDTSEKIDELLSEKILFKKQFDGLRDEFTDLKSSLKDELSDWDNKLSSLSQGLLTDYNHIANVIDDLNRSCVNTSEDLQKGNSHLKDLSDSAFTIYSKETDDLLDEVASMKQTVRREGDVQISIEDVIRHNRRYQKKTNRILYFCIVGILILIILAVVKLFI